VSNLIGNYVATVVVAVWEGDIDRAQARRVLDGEIDVSTEKVLAGPAEAIEPLTA